MQDEILIVDDFIPNHMMQYLQKTALRDDLVWNLHLATVTGANDTHQMVLVIRNEYETKCPHLVHMFTDCIQPYLEKELDRKVKSLVRCKLNMVTPAPVGTPIAHHQPHKDVEYDEVNENLYSCIVYLFDSDGATYFFDENCLNVNATVDPSEGRCAVFHYNQYHASSSPKKSPMRIVMNCVIEFEKES